MTNYLFWNTGYMDINEEFYADFKFINVGFKKIFGGKFYAKNLSKRYIVEYDISIFILLQTLHFIDFCELWSKMCFKKHFQTGWIQFKFNVEGPYFTDNQSGILEDCCIFKRFHCIRRATAKNSSNNGFFGENCVTYIAVLKIKIMNRLYYYTIDIQHRHFIMYW